MEYSKDNIMTRKEYLKSKKKNKFDFSKIKHILVFITIVVLSIYVFKQLDVYNSVTKIANKVVEETALTRTMTMYYVSESYTKEDVSCVMLYRSSDESRTKIDGTDEMYNITLNDNKLYGLKDEMLSYIDLITMSGTQVLDTKIKEYIVKGDEIYYYNYESDKKAGIYRYDIKTDESNQVISGKIYQMTVDDNYIYVVAAGKTSKSIIRYNLNGENKKELSDKYIVSHIAVYGDNVFFINSKDSKLYMVPRAGGEIKKVTDNSVKTTGLDYSAYSSLIAIDDNVYYIIK